MELRTPAIDRIGDKRRGTRGGFTLMEAMIASTVLAVAVVGISGLLSSSYAQSSRQEQSAITLSLARQLMEEIRARPLALPDGSASLPGWSSGVTDHRLYDTVDDYNGYTDQSNALTTLAGLSVNIGGGEIFTRSVSVTSGVRPTGHTVAPSGDFAVVRVTVTSPRGQSVTISQFLTKVNVER